MDRGTLIAVLAEELASLVASGYARAAVDGVDGAGKTTFADELAVAVRARGRPVVRVSADGFHHPRSVRYRRGRNSPEGFYRDSYDLTALRRDLLDPLGPHQSGRFRRQVFDVETDRAEDAPVEQAEPRSLLLVDGIFLHRPELVDCWDWSVWLAVSADVSVARCAARDGTSADLLAPGNRRYVEGQALYIAEVGPDSCATHVVENDVLATPQLVR